MDLPSVPRRVSRRSCRSFHWAVLWHCCACSKCWTSARSWLPGGQEGRLLAGVAHSAHNPINSLPLSLHCRGDPAAADLAGLAAQHLLLVDHWLLDGAMAACNRLLQPCSAAAERPGAAAAAAALRSAAVGVVRQTDDCLRKPVLARWLLEEADG